MEIILIVATLFIGSVLNFATKPKGETVCDVAKGYIILVVIISISSWLFYFAGFKNQLLNTILEDTANWGKYLGRLTLGYLAVNILIALGHATEDYPIKKMARLTLIGVSILTGGTFLSATVGKATNFAEMTAFFTTSGYATWFLYFIMAAETLGAIGILLHFKLRTGPLATTGLMLIMIGALYTHRHNNDPFSDSYAAVSQFITLFIMLLIYYFEREAVHKTGNAGEQVMSKAVI